MTSDVYDYICSIGELIDKLSIQNIICYDSNMKILEERGKPSPSAARISDLEFKARKAGEQRVRLRNEFDRRLAEALTRGKIHVTTDARTYELPGA